jgi:DNA-binding CsgD family transcriptional regulator
VQLQKLRDLTNFLAKNRDITELAIFLGVNCGPNYELCKVYIGNLQFPGLLTHESSFGYVKSELLNILQIELDEKRPINEAIKSNKIIVKTNDDAYYLEYPNAAYFTDSWHLIINIPMLPNYAMTLALTGFSNIKDTDKAYFEHIGAIVSLHLNFPYDKSDENPNSKKSALKGTELTERQQAICKLMRIGKTNFQISETINYSESLVRQETVIVFAKLGISGRKGL